MAARILAQRFQGDLRVVEIEGTPGTSACYERGIGFNEELRKYPRIKVAAREVANFDRKEAQVVTQRIILNDNNFDAVFAHNDEMILGAIDALEKSEDQRQRILIGFDAIREAKEAVRQGRLTATIAQEPETMGRSSIETAVQYFRGQEINPTLFVDLSVVTK